jgi:hypothetical protein
VGDKNILAECYGDTLLVSQLNHEPFSYHSGIGGVAKQMQKYYKNKKAIAIIDNDKMQPSYFDSECLHIKTEKGVILMKHKGRSTL